MPELYLPDEIGPASTKSLEHRIDPWTFLDYKQMFDTKGGLGTNLMPPSWVGDHHRRLQAYKIFEDYWRNHGRAWLSTDADEETVRTRREYGDPFVVVEQYLNSLLGDDQSIVVPATKGKGVDSPEVAFFNAMVDWADDEMLDLKVEENERNTLKLGDGVYILGEHPITRAPVVEVWDPGFYFPVLDPEAPSSQYPTKVNIAYEFERWVGSEKRKFVRKRTWWLDGTLVVPEGEPEAEPVAANILYPWNEQATDQQCWYRESEWLLGDIDTKKPGAEDLEWENGITIVEPRGLGIDFIPIVHIPGLLPSLAEHFGISILSSVMQIFDDLVATDTDIQSAAATTGSPPISLSGATLPNSEGRVETYGPGQVFTIGDGKMDMIDTSRSLDALLKLDEHLLSRMSVNGRIPESMLGRVKPSEVPSGIALTISFGPHRGVVTKMRRIRRRKYALLFKFVARLIQKVQAEKGEQVMQTFPVEYHFGSFLPSDRAETMNLVVQGLTSKPPSISQETAMQMLIEAGYPVEDAEEEIKRINEQDFESANEMLEATGDPDAVRKRLGITGPVPVPPQAPPTGDTGETTEPV